MSVTKIHKKSSSFWKHGKHKGLKEIAIQENKKNMKKDKFEKLDLSKSDWSRNND